MRHRRFLVLLPLLLAAKQASAPVTFVGIDYTLAKFIATDDFKQPSLIFPGFLDSWNQVWADEMMADMDKAIGPVTLSNTPTHLSNQRANASQVVPEDGPPGWVEETDITEEALTRLIGSYQMQETDGLGLVLVVDRYLKVQETGCTWIVYFDIASREIRARKRACAKAGGIGFRTYWFRTEANLLSDIKKTKPSD